MQVVESGGESHLLGEMFISFEIVRVLYCTFANNRHVACEQFVLLNL